MAETNFDTDVLIVGAGPTGLTLANLLGRMGVRTLVVERNATTVDEPRAVSIDDESMRVMQAIGLSREIEAIVASGYGSRYLSPSRRCFALVDPISKEYGFDKRNGFQQPELEDELRRGLDRWTTTRCLFRHEFVAFRQTNAGVVAEAQAPDGGDISISSRYLVGADGGRSSVRKQLGVALEGSTFAERWLIVDLARTENRFRHTEVFCDPRRPSITLPGPGGIRRYEFMLRAGEDELAMVQEAFVRRLLEETGPDRDAELRRVRVYTFHARSSSKWREGRVFLAGDAAHLTPPFAGQGMNSGLRDAHNLAWKLAEALAAADAEPILASYEIERKPHAWEMIMLALRMGQVMMPTSRWQGLAVRALFRTLSLYPPARDYLAQMKYKPKPRFRAGLVWADGRRERVTVVGRLLPQPLVEDAGRARRLFDECLPDRPIVLVFDEFPDRALRPGDREALSAAGAAIVGLTPEWMNPAPQDFPVLRDVSRFFSQQPWRGYLGSALLLRRDRYVAAAAPIARACELLDCLRTIAPGGPPATLATLRFEPANA
ncbi:MAG: bifunctional 3-(3-hydroxy-phenyl)propionate/3-hydroxycinnamic acid hydroxylase [Roseiarcus sp.]